jgi:hypothetical protein
MPASMNKQNKHLKPNHDLSSQDKACITINYPPDNNTNEMVWLVEQALDVVGVDNMKKKQIMNNYQTNQCTRLREEFAEWSRSAIGHGGLIIDPFWVRLGGDNWPTQIQKNIPGLAARIQAIDEDFQKMGVDPAVWFCNPPPSP